jgi:hypothetical protein
MNIKESETVYGFKIYAYFFFGMSGCEVAANDVNFDCKEVLNISPNCGDI